jgi:glycosyltransferase involved in cell wall biosynthesis
MRIVMIASGTLEYAAELAKAMAEHQQVSLLVPRRKFAPLAWVVGPNVDLHLLEWPRQRDPRSLFFVGRVHQLIEQLRPDVIHFIIAQTWLNALMPLSSQHTFVTTVHDVVPHVGDTASLKIPNWIGDFSVRHAHRLIVHGHKLRSELANRYHLPLDRIDVIPHGVLSFYRRLLPSSNGTGANGAGRPEVLFFGRIYKYKGLDYLIQAQPAITQAIPEARIIIAGRGEDFDKYQAMFPEPDKFEIYNDYISNEQVAELFHRAKVVVLPYIDGSQSGVLQVAYAFGKPVVVTRVGSIDEAVDDGRTGLLVPPRDSHALAEAVVQLLSDQPRREHMRRQIEEQVNTRFAWRHIAEATVQTYQRARERH